MWRELSGVFSHWRLLLALVYKELTVRYKGSLLGIFWSLITPLFLMLIYSFIFGVLYQKFAMDSYHIYLLTGLLPWTFFSISLSNSINSFLANGGLVTRVYFPRSLIPISICLSQAVHMIISLIPLVLFMLIADMSFTPRLAWLPVILLIQVVMTSGLAMLLSTSFVFFRDIQHLMETVLTGWFFLSPIIYPASMLQNRPAIWAVLKWNPMNPFLELYHRVLYYPTYQELPLLAETFAVAVAFALGFFFLGLFFLTRNEAEMIKVL
jgi:homopolymeric O-antigen transport system permease protein